MRAIAMTDYDSGLALQELPAPDPAANELLVRVRASSINRIDALVAAGWLRGMMEHEFPVVPGRDFAGVVERAGAAVTRFAAGDEVYGFLGWPTLHAGAWAEYLVTPEDTFVAPKPGSLDFVHAAALPLAGITALAAVEAADLSAGSVVLVAGASGGVGSYAVQLAALAGATVIATAKPGDASRLAELGAAETVDYSTVDVAEAVRAAHPGGIDALIDAVSQADGFAPLAALVKDGGRAASVLGAADVEALAARGVVAANVMAKPDPALLARLASLADAGELAVTIDAVFPLEQAPAAVERFNQGKRGKIAISI